MNRTLAAAALALTLGMSVAPTFASEVTERNEALIAACPLNEAGDALLAQGLQDARYDYASGAYMAFNQLGFGKAEFKRSLASQKEDVMIRTARALHRVNDEMTLSMAKNYGLQNFFYADTLICLKGAFRETKGEAAYRIAAEERRAAKAEAERVQRDAEMERARKQQIEEMRVQQAAWAKETQKRREEAEADRARAQALQDQHDAWQARHANNSKNAFQNRLLQEEAAWAKGAKVKDVREHCGESRTRPELKPSCDELARRGLPH